MGRHSIGYHPEHDDSPAASHEHVAPDSSIAPPGDPGTPDAPSVPGGPSVPDPGPSEPQPDPGSPEITPSEPPPFAPDDAGDGTTPPPAWHTAGEQVL